MIWGDMGLKSNVNAGIVSDFFVCKAFFDSKFS